MKERRNALPVHHLPGFGHTVFGHASNRTSEHGACSKFVTPRKQFPRSCDAAVRPGSPHSCIVRVSLSILYASMTLGRYYDRLGEGAEPMLMRWASESL